MPAVAPGVPLAASAAFEDAASAVASSNGGFGDFDGVELFAASGAGPRRVGARGSVASHRPGKVVS